MNTENKFDAVINSMQQLVNRIDLGYNGKGYAETQEYNSYKYAMKQAEDYGIDVDAIRGSAVCNQELGMIISRIRTQIENCNNVLGVWGYDGGDFGIVDQKINLMSGMISELINWSRSGYFNEKLPVIIETNLDFLAGVVIEGNSIMDDWKKLQGKLDGMSTDIFECIGELEQDDIEYDQDIIVEYGTDENNAITMLN